MSNHVVFNGVDDAAKARLEAYWTRKLPRLQKLLVPYRTDLQEIRLTVSTVRNCWLTPEDLNILRACASVLRRQVRLACVRQGASVKSG
jgi:hypothetical protein